MIKNTVIVSAEQAATSYNEAMIEHLYHDRKYMAIGEYASDLIRLGEEIKGMLSTSSQVAPGTFRKLFSEGATMMMLESEDFEQLEKWHENGEDFNVVVFRENGDPVGLFTKEHVVW